MESEKSQGELLEESRQDTLRLIRGAQGSLAELEKIIQAGGVNEERLRAVRTAIDGIFEMMADERFKSSE